MRIFFTDDCAIFFLKMCKNPSHKHLLTELFDFFKNRNSPNGWSTGYRISKGPKGGLFLKDRFEGSGGYRFYFLVTISDNDVIISSFYPKKGKYSKSDLSTKQIKASLKSAIQSKIDNNRHEVQFNVAEKCIFLVKEVTLEKVEKK